MAATLRENKIATMAARAAQMEVLGCISLPNGSRGEDILADFCADMVTEYDEIGTDKPFDLFIEKALTDKFGIRQRANAYHNRDAR